MTMKESRRHRAYLSLPGRIRAAAVVLAVLTSVPWGSALAGGYDELRRGYERYEGSEYQRRNVSVETEEAGAGPAGGGRAAALGELDSVRKLLSSTKQSRRASVLSAVTENGLFTPEPAFWERLGRAGDREAVEALLAGDYGLDRVLAAALRRNPAVKAATESALAALEKYDQVSNLDEILGQYSLFTKELDVRVGRERGKRAVQLDFPFPGMLALKGAIVDQEALIARWELEKAVEDAITETKTAYYELVYLDHAVDITEETLGLLRRLREVINTVYTTGRASLNDVIKIQIEIDVLENDLREYEQRRSTVQVRLNKLLDLSDDFSPPAAVDPGPVMLDYTEAALYELGGGQRSEIKALEAKIARTERAIEMAEKRFYPDYTVGLSLFQNRMSARVGAAAGDFSFPTRPMVRGGAWFGSNDAYIRETRLKYKAMRRTLEELKNDTVSDISRMIFGYENAVRDRALYESKLVPKSRLTIDITETQYITGKVDYMDLISSQQMYLTFSLRLKGAERDMNIHAARLERLVGSAIERRLPEK